MARFADRDDAGRRLADAVAARLAAAAPMVVLGLPRGGVPVAARIAERLGAPLGVLAVRKLGVPGHAELAMGALARIEDRVHLVRNEEVLAHLLLPAAEFDRIVERERAVLAEQAHQYPGPLVAGRTVLIVDDGLATGATMRAAIAAARQAGAAQVLVAAPVASRSAAAELAHIADGLICLHTPTPFLGVGASYDDFSPTDTSAVQDELARAAARMT